MQTTNTTRRYEVTGIDTYVSLPADDTNGCPATQARAIAAGRVDLLDHLRRLRAIRDGIDDEMRILIALGRCFTHPRPYTLRSLADAAGTSVSGIRTYTTDRHAEYIRDVLGTNGITTWKDTNPR